eukprot:CAMPEP_0197076186 /NCGR_PEP_ID=MMETSP1384-20130603/211987_1 /TAXON_ID=29189 /ORGANISM="Ammonia sp." /LENGTH=321 /DNA_ID=CAMNT_0042515035 /DNA_START=668 /DNA_END=1631 /DNA_ORIENTATION=-
MDDHTSSFDNYGKERLNHTFELSNSWNSIIAIFSGFIGSYSIFFYQQLNILQSLPSCAAAFHFSCLLLCITLVLICWQWDENYGHRASPTNSGDGNTGKQKQQQTAIGVVQSIRHCMRIIVEDKRILFIGIIQAGFESSLYIFVFMWSKLLHAAYVRDAQQVDTFDDFDHGTVFAIMMISCFIGTAVVRMIRLKSKAADSGMSTPQRIEREHHFNWIQCMELSAMCLGCGLSLLCMVFVHSFHVRLLMIVLFEINVGGYRPTISSLRSKYVPHQYMATCLNVFRVPLNIIVVAVLINIEYLDSFVLVIAFLMLAVCCTVAW